MAKATSCGGPLARGLRCRSVGCERLLRVSVLHCNLLIAQNSRGTDRTLPHHPPESFHGFSQACVIMTADPPFSGKAPAARAPTTPSVACRVDALAPEAAYYSVRPGLESQRHPPGFICRRAADPWPGKRSTHIHGYFCSMTRALRVCDATSIAIALLIQKCNIPNLLNRSHVHPIFACAAPQI